jgi:predicted alpha/beta-hydrolase family hydrolase
MTGCSLIRAGDQPGGTLASMQTVEIPWETGRAITGHLVEGDRRCGMLLAHGAGAGQDHPLVTRLRDGIAADGYPVLTFNYPYMEAGRRQPDRPAVLLAAHKAAASWFKSEVTGHVILAGRSMGGRIASLLVADGERAEALICYSYPLHPPGRFDRLRVEHFSRIHVPMLFFVGGRDAFARPDLVDLHLRPLPGATVEVIEAADHALGVLKRSGMTRDEAIATVVRESLAWIESTLDCT